MTAEVAEVSGPNTPAVEDFEARGDALKRAGETADAIEAYLAAADAHEVVPATLCLKLARCYLARRDDAEVVRWVRAVADDGDEFDAWNAAAMMLRKVEDRAAIPARRRAKLSLAGSFTTLQLAPLLRLAALRHGLDLEISEEPYGVYRQSILDPNSALYSQAPDFVLLAVHAGDLALPFLSAAPERDVETELARWTSLWEKLAGGSAARVVQFNFAPPAEAPLGHLGARVAGARHAMIGALNARLGAAAHQRVAIVDCERLSAQIGRENWTDPRYWHLSRQAVALTALPLLARHVTAVLCAELGLNRKCLVLDLDNVVWGGVVGEDGLGGIKLGHDVEGEAFVAFQEYVRQLKEKGVILAACSKNNASDVREVFTKHPEMRLQLGDFAVMAVSWDPKPEQLAHIARTLNIGADALVFLDDSPIERQAVRRALPEVDVIQLPPNPALYVRALANYPMFETSAFTREDAARTDQYRARAEVARLSESVGSLEELWASLDMHAVVAPFDELNLPRIVQLIGKTNQFNLTSRRHSQAAVREFMQDPACVHLSLRLRDRFADHGLVALLIARQHDDRLDLDTWLMSCRVIGRSIESAMLAKLCEHASRRGVRRLRGEYIRTPKNSVVHDLFARFHFERVAAAGDGELWEYDLAGRGPIANRFIAIEETGDARDRTG